jgi:branched-chain amino acid transport system substrate-binding protein
LRPSDENLGGSGMKIRRFAVLFAVLALLGAACGGDDEPEETASGSEVEAGQEDEGTEGGDCTLDEPVKVVGLAETTGEGPQAVPYYANGWEMGVAAVNEAGGICGQDVEFERLPVSPTDSAAAKNSFLQAVDAEADVVLGIPSSAPIVALGPDIVSAGIPTIGFAAAPNVFTDAEESVGGDNLFIIRPRNSGVGVAQSEYMVQTLGKKKIGLVCVNQTFGQQGCDAAEPAIEAAGGEIVARETHEVTDTNLTSKVLALKNAGVDGIVAFTFPNTGVVLFNQMAENGLNVPIIGGAIPALAIATGNVTEAAVANVYGLDDCAPAVEERASEFAAAYEAEYGAPPTYSAAQAYDSLFIVKQAIEAAGSVDPAAVTEAMSQVEYEGACTDYSVDGGNGLAQTAVIESFTADGKAKVEETVEIPAS